jgi:DNA polymerase-4/DNA polymerase IV (DinB-like DNA polymerase)
MENIKAKDRKIIHIDMDMFYAAVEIRDNPVLSEKPLIIGSLPNERGVVATCSYKAREFGVRSAMSISEAYRLCPDGIYMRPNFSKYTKASREIHAILETYTDIVEYISLDEGFLDVTDTTKLFGSATEIGKIIKNRVNSETGLPCSVGVGYSKTSAKIASEEKKPNGFFVIPTAEDFVDLISDRNVRVIYGVGAQTAAKLKQVGITTVSDVKKHPQTIISLFGKHGQSIVNLANGIDERPVEPSSKAQSLGKEHTFQNDISDFDYLKDVLRLLAKELSFQIRKKEIYCHTITLKVTYAGMKKITRSKSAEATNKADDFYNTAASLLDTIDKAPIRLIGISLSGFTDTVYSQLSIFDTNKNENPEKLASVMLALQRKYGIDIVKTGSELSAEKRLGELD